MSRPGVTVGTSGTPRTWVAALVVACVAIAVMAAFELGGRVPFSSDQAVIAQMAEDILDHGKHPVFCYGSQYGGTVEAHMIAAAFAIAGRSPVVYRVTTCILVLGAVLAGWWLARRAYGEDAGWVAGLYLAVAPGFYLYKMMTSDGSYAALVLFSTCALAFLVDLDARVAAGRSAAWATVGFGMCAGLAWWQHSPAAFLAVPFAVWLVLPEGRRWLRPVHVSLLVTATLVGAFPWWWHNARHGWMSLTAPELKAASGETVGVRIVELVTSGFPTLLGGQSLRADAGWLPGSAAWVDLLLLVATVAALSRGGPGEAPGARRRGLVLLAALAAAPLLALSIRRTDYAEPRYLVVMVPVLAALLGRALTRRGRATQLLGLGALLLFNAGSERAAPIVGPLSISPRATGPQPLVSWLEAQSADRLYASYWSAYRTSFLSHGRLAVAPFGSDNNSFVRGDDDLRRVDAAPAPGFLLDGVDRARFREYLRRRGVAPREARLGRFVLFTDLPAAAVAPARLCHCVPAAFQPSDLAGVTLDAPATLRPGAIGQARLRFHWNVPFPPSNNVLLGYGLSSEPGYRGRPERADLVTWSRESDQTVTFRAPSAPGSYWLSVDLVDERVEWFSGLEGALARAPIEVR